MATYSSLLEAYHDPHMSQLDEMAREINNNNKRKNLMKDVAEEGRKEARKYKEIADKINDDSNAPFKYFSVQGDFNDIPEGITADDLNSELQSFPESLNDSLKNSSNSNKYPAVSNNKYTDKIKELALEIKNHHDNDDSSIDSINSTIEHIKKCSKCKRKFIDIVVLKKKKHVFKHEEPYAYKDKKRHSKYKHKIIDSDYSNSDDYSDDYNEDYYRSHKKPKAKFKQDLVLEEKEKEKEKESFSFSSLFNKTELKDVLIIILIGIVIIIILDIYNRATKNK